MTTESIMTPVGIEMAMVEYYNFLNVGFDYVKFILINLAILTGTGTFYILRKRFGKSFTILTILSLTIWILLTYVIFYTYNKHNNLQEKLRENQTKVIEGIVTDFVPMPVGGHVLERFSVKGINFDYSNSLGFHQEAIQGGPIIEGAYVRIYYVENQSYQNNHILRLEIEKEYLVPIQLKRIKWFKAKEKTTEDKTKLHLTGNLPFRAYAFDKIDTSTKGDTLTIVPHLKLTERDPYKPDKLDYTIELKPSINRVLFGKEREEIWKRQ